MTLYFGSPVPGVYGLCSRDGDICLDLVAIWEHGNYHSVIEDDIEVFEEWFTYVLQHEETHRILLEWGLDEANEKLDFLSEKPWRLAL